MESLSDSVFNDEIDLMLVDWDLGSGLEGQAVIAQIRTLVRYRDVVFYSAREPDALRQRAFDAKLEGVYYASRELLVEEVKGVFDSLIKKVLDLDHTRGIVMGATSDIDNIVSESLGYLHAQSSSDKQAKILAKALANLRKSLKSSQKTLSKLQEAKTMNDLLQQKTSIFSAYHRLLVLRSAIAGSGLAKEEQFSAALSTYIDKVVPDRNILGHVVLVPKGKSNAVIGSDGTPKSIDEMRALRKLLLDLRLVLHEMHGELQLKATETPRST